MPKRPEIVCICGSIRFAAEMRAANRDLTFAGVASSRPARRLQGAAVMSSDEVR